MKNTIQIIIILFFISCNTKQKKSFIATEKYFDSIPYEFKLKLDSAIKSSGHYKSYNQYYKDKKVSFYVCKNNYWRMKGNDSIAKGYQVIFSYDTVEPGPLWLTKVFVDSTTLKVTYRQTN